LTTPVAWKLTATGIAVPLVHLLCVPAGFWAFTSDAVPINKSDTNINRNAVFILSPAQIFGCAHYG
jgi:hypothetical protein